MQNLINDDFLHRKGNKFSYKEIFGVLNFDPSLFSYDKFYLNDDFCSHLSDCKVRRCRETMYEIFFSPILPKILFLNGQELAEAMPLSKINFNFN